MPSTSPLLSCGRSPLGAGSGASVGPPSAPPALCSGEGKGSAGGKRNLVPFPGGAFPSPAPAQIQEALSSGHSVHNDPLVHPRGPRVSGSSPSCLGFPWFLCCDFILHSACTNPFKFRSILAYVCGSLLFLASTDAYMIQFTGPLFTGVHLLLNFRRLGHFPSAF